MISFCYSHFFLTLLLFSYLYCFGSWNNGFVSLGRCGHCKKLAPEYEKLGSSFKKAKTVLIGKVSSLNPYYYFVLLLYSWMYDSGFIILVAKFMGLFLLQIVALLGLIIDLKNNIFSSYIK